MLAEAVTDTCLTWAEISLDAIAQNVAAFKRHVGEHVEIFAVVKANAYGHGAAPVARAALRAGATRLAVHRLSEGVALRQAGIDAPILLMGYTPPSGAEAALRWRLTPSLITLEFAQALAASAQANGIRAPVHLKVDTGMSRYGLLPDEVAPFVQGLRALPGLQLEGLFTHFATADAAEQADLRQQLAVFQDVLAALHNADVVVPLVHAASSAATMRLPETHFNAVRIGIAMYGLDPSDEWPPVFGLQPALALKSQVSRVRTLPAGAGISYGRTYVTPAPATVALVSAGYGDGYHRILSNQGSVLIHGQRAPILGRVCMDQCVVDVSHIPGVALHDEVVLIGAQGDARIRAEEVARLAGTINYEVTTSLLPRVPRIYMQEGQIFELPLT
jgi:alanine racemase